MVCQCCQIHWLGQLDFQLAYALQKKLSAKRAGNEIDNVLLLLEHQHIFTFGFNGYGEYLRFSEEEIADRSIACYRVNRNGPAAFYHGPGQLVAYPIISLREYGYSYHDYIKLLEKVIIQTLAVFKVHAYSEPGCSGISVVGNSVTSDGVNWLYSDNNAAMIAAVGIDLDHNNITQHGFFINVNPNLEHFKQIMLNNHKPCNFTSLQEILGKLVSVKTVADVVAESFTRVFGFESKLDKALPVIKQRGVNGSQAMPGGWISEKRAFESARKSER